MPENNIFYYQQITNNFIDKHKDELDWKIISSYRKLDEEFIDKYQYKVNWKLISRFQELSESFIEKHKNRVDWYNKSSFILYKNILKYQNYCRCLESLEKRHY